MIKLSQHLKFFIKHKIQNDKLWKGFTVIYSGPEVGPWSLRFTVSYNIIGTWGR